MPTPPSYLFPRTFFCSTDEKEFLPFHPCFLLFLCCCSSLPQANNNNVTSTAHVCLFVFCYFHVRTAFVSTVPEMHRLVYYGVCACGICLLCHVRLRGTKSLFIGKKIAHVISASALFLFHVLHHSGERRGLTSGDLTGLSHLSKVPEEHLLE